LNETLLEKLNVRVDEISKKYENPTDKDLRKPQSFRRDVGNFGDVSRRREDRGGRREDRKYKQRSDLKNKKRKKFGRR